MRAIFALLKAYILKTEPFCSLETHTHPEQTEIREAIFGSGECQIAERQISYSTGIIEVIPQNVAHMVTAGKDGLYILAKFTPALI